MMNIVPLKKRVLVAENKSETKTDSGLILDHTTSARESKSATVLAVGPDCTEVKIGDVVYLDWSKGQLVKLGDAQRVMIDESNIVAILEKTATEVDRPEIPLGQH